MKGIRKVCSRGHIFYKSSDCPVCPKCWAGYYRTKNQSDFPAGLSAPALRALLNAKITKLKQLSKWTAGDVAELHGMGPTGIKVLKLALREKQLSFATHTVNKRV